MVNSDDNDYFSFHGYGVSRRQFEAYVEKVTTAVKRKIHRQVESGQGSKSD